MLEAGQQHVHVRTAVRSVFMSVWETERRANLTRENMSAKTQLYSWKSDTQNTLQNTSCF